MMWWARTQLATFAFKLKAQTLIFEFHLFIRYFFMFKCQFGAFQFECVLILLFTPLVAFGHALKFNSKSYELDRNVFVFLVELLDFLFKTR
ncbi:MAG: hypothetical protein HOP19_19215 [Acidobacteria bacterium]|nr:hypothetical protein [Acidobacteriota bacterium]